MIPAPNDSKRFRARRPKSGRDSDRHAAVTAFKGKSQRKAAPPAEIELKLLGEPEALQAVITSSVVQRHSLGDVAVAALHAIYYDTPDGALLQRHWALRVRSADDSQHTMTLKTPLSAANTGGLSRNEWNATAPGADLDRALLAEWFGAYSHTTIDIAALQPLFATRVQRRTCQLKTRRGIVELAADTGAIVSGSRTAPICEIELELVSGSVDAVFALAEELLAEFPLRPSVRSKAARGYDLSLGRSPAATRAAPASLGRDATLDEALQSALQGIFSHVMENLEAAVDCAQPGGVHQLRVGLRRLRSVLGVMAPMAATDANVELLADAKWLMSELGPARNWDVFATEVVREAREACGAEIDFAALDANVARRRQAAHEQARAALNAPRTARFLIKLAGWVSRRGWRENASTETLAQLAAPASIFASHIARKRLKNMLEKGRNFNNSDAAGLHDTRLAIKKFRYVTDIFQAHLPAMHTCKQFGPRLAKLQDGFGQYNDLHAAVTLLRECNSDDPSRTPAHALASGAIMGWQAARQPELLRRLRRQWRRFRDIARPMARR